MKSGSKNIKISEKHHEILKSYCEKNGFKMYRVVEKWIDEFSKPKKEKGDIYGE